MVLVVWQERLLSAVAELAVFRVEDPLALNVLVDLIAFVVAEVTAATSHWQIE